MKKKTSPQLLLAFIALIFFFSCKKTNDLAPGNSITGDNPIPAAVEKQINDAKQNLASMNLPASIISYKTDVTLKDENQLNQFKKSLVASDNMVPDFDGANVSTFDVSSVRERMAAYKKSPELNLDVVKNIEDIVYPELKTGQKVLDILWQANGKQFHTRCVYDDNGIVYDNMMSNIVRTEIGSVAPDELKALPGGENLSNSKTAKQYSFTSTVRDITIKWLWGSTRGKVVIKHYIIWNGYNYIYDHGGSTDAWMSVGSASARWANNYLNRSSRSKMAWGYGWATPTASFSIKYDYKNLSFSTSVSGVGSKGSGSGIHTIYF